MPLLEFTMLILKLKNRKNFLSLTEKFRENEKTFGFPHPKILHSQNVQVSKNIFCLGC
jgi:hypothetical protein